MVDQVPKTATEQPATTADVIDLIVGHIKRHNHKLITRETAKSLYDALIEFAIKQTITHGHFKLPYGYGNFYLKLLGMGAKPRRLPNGEVRERRPRPMVRYKQGTSVASLIANRPTGRQLQAARRTQAIRNLKSQRKPTDSAVPSSEQ